MRAASLCLRLLGIICCVAVFIVGVCGIVGAVEQKVKLNWGGVNGVSESELKQWALSDVNWPFAAASLSGLLCLLSILGFVAELHCCGVLYRQLKLLRNLHGMGVFYMLLGFLTLGIAGNLGIIVGAVTMVLGLLFLIAGALCGHRIYGGYEEI